MQLYIQRLKSAYCLKFFKFLSYGSKWDKLGTFQNSYRKYKSLTYKLISPERSNHTIFMEKAKVGVSKTRNCVTGNGVTRNRVTGLFFLSFFFFSDAVFNYFKPKKVWKNTKMVNKDFVRAGSCYERNSRQNIHQVFIRVKYSFNQRKWRSQIWPSQSLFVAFYLSPLLVSLNPKYLAFGTLSGLSRFRQSNSPPAGFNVIACLHKQKDLMKPKDLTHCRT